MTDDREPGGAEDPLLLVGTIRKPHGVRGELFVWTETDRPASVFRPGRALRLGEAKGDAIGDVLTIERARPFKDGYLVKTVEHASRTEELEALRGRSLFIHRSEAAPLEEDEVFYHDLIGMRVDAGGDAIGTVREVYETAGADLLVVQRPDKSELLIPFVRDTLVRLDREARVLVIDPPEGLLEL
jgi:16S rRNA processing protein RimM